MKMRRAINVVVYILLLVIGTFYCGCSKGQSNSNTDKSEFSSEQPQANTDQNGFSSEQPQNNTDNSDDAEGCTYLKKLPSQFINGDDPVICLDKMDLEYSTDSIFQVTVHILSKELLDESNVKVEINSDIKCSLMHVDSVETKQKFQKNTCMLYNNVDWAHLRELEDAAVVGDEEKEKEFAEFNKDIDKDYASLSDAMFPTFYDNTFLITIDTSGINLKQDEVINKITFLILGKSYVQDIGSIRLHYTKMLSEAEAKKIYGDYDLSFTSAGRSQINISDQKGGIFMLPPYELVAEKDVKIKDIKLDRVSDKIAIEKVCFQIETDGNMIDQQWKEGDEILIPKGSKPNVTFYIKSTDLDKKKNYFLNVRLIIVYEVNGKEFQAETSASCETRYDADVLYAMFKDDIDCSSYYNNYVQTGEE